VPSKKSKREYGRSFGVGPGAAACLAALALIAGCGGDDEPSPEPLATEASDTAASNTETAPAPDIKDTTQKPVIEKPTGPVPRKLERVDVVKGKGPAAKPGDQLSVQYVGITFSTGEQFDASWDSGQPFSFQLGSGEVIPGWDRGLVGMKQGGRRHLTIPPRLAYGAQGSPPSIGPNETLVFVIDLVNRR
jgi:peptidylprolyl isomerase